MSWDNERLIEFGGGALSPDDFKIRSLHGSEGVSELYTFHVDMISGRDDIDARTKLGEAVSVKINSQNSDTPRWIHGHVAEWEYNGQESSGVHRYSTSIVPSLWFMGIGTDTKTHTLQNESAKDFCIKYLSENAPIKVEVDCAVNNSQSFNASIIQYNESNLDFFLRYLANSGISFYFEHTEDSHKLVLLDNEKLYPSAANTFAFSHSAKFADKESVVGWRERSVCIAGEYKHADYTNASSSINFETSKAQKVPTSLQSAISSRYSAASSVLSDKIDTKDSSVGQTSPQILANWVKAEQQANDARQTSYHTISDSPAFYAGLRINLEPLPRPNVGELLVRRVVHTATDGIEQSATYSNQLVLGDADQNPLPLPQPSPTIHGDIIARVAETQYGKGEPGKKLFYGKVKVKFPWDDVVTHWLSVTQSFGGKSTSGAWFLPQENDDVLVSFIDGCADRPVVTGVVYNSKTNFGPAFENDSVSAVPEHRMGIRHPAEHELSFTGAQPDKGEVYIRSSHDFHRVIKNDETAKIEKSQEYTITSGDTRFFMDKDQIKMSVGESSLTLEKNGKITMKGVNFVFDASNNIDSKAGNNATLDAGMNVEVSSGMKTDIKAGMKSTVSAPQAEVAGSATVTIKGGMVMIN